MKQSMRLATIMLLLTGVVAPAWALVVHRVRPHRPARRVVLVGRQVAMATPVVIAGRPHGAVDTDVSPEETLVLVDGKVRGTCDNFDGYPAKLYLLPGIHTITLRTPDGKEHSQRLRIVAGQEINLGLELRE